jgi:transcriptional regulator with XRE-family HTH domain
MFISMNGEKVRELREAQALPKKDLARLANVTQTTIARAERSQQMFPATTRKIADALGVDPHRIGKRA